LERTEQKLKGEMKAKKGETGESKESRDTRVVEVATPQRELYNT